MTSVCERVDTLIPAPKKIQVSQGNRRPLPANIAIASDHALLLKGLPLGARNVLSEIARHLKKANPLGTVFPSKETIAERIGINERSVYRHLNTLEDAALIEREPQKHRKGTGIGEFLTGHIKLTLKGAAYLGLVEWQRPALPLTQPQAPCDATADDASTVTQEVQDVAAATLEQASKSARDQVIPSEPSDKMAVHNKSLTEPKYSALKRTAPATSRAMATVPAELTWLLRSGIKAGEIFFLMGIATQNQNHLSDISEAKKAVLVERGLKGRDLKAFLLALTKSDVCFKTLACRARTAAAEANQKAVYAQEAAIFKARFAQVTLASRDLTKIHEIDANCEFIRTWDGSTWSSAPLHDLKPWMAAMKSGQLILATKAVEECIRNSNELLGSNGRQQTVDRSACRQDVKHTEPRRASAQTNLDSKEGRAPNQVSLDAMTAIKSMMAKARRSNSC